MTEARFNRLVDELSKLDKDEFNTFIHDVEQKREEYHREQLKEAFNAFDAAWEKMEELGYYAAFSFGDTEEKSIPLDFIIWREVK